MRRWPLKTLIEIAVCLTAVAAIALALPFVNVWGPKPPDPLLSRLHALWVATKLYESDLNGLPDMRTPEALKGSLCSAYIHDEKILLNPHDGRPIRPNVELAGLRLKQIPEAENVVMYYGATGDPDRPVAFVTRDGHSRKATMDEMKRLGFSSLRGVAVRP